MIIIFFIPYTASGFAACGKLFSSLFGADYVAAMVISAIVIVGYTAAGGFLAASTTDFIQSIIMTIAIVFVLVFSTISAGGIDAVMEKCQGASGLSFPDSYLCGGDECRGRLQFSADSVYAGMGAGIFWYASHSAPLHGD